MATQLGWTVTPFAWQIVAGVDATQRMTLEVEQENGDPLPSYDGWTCRVAFKSPYTFGTAFTLTPTVTGDDIAKTLSADLAFTADTTGMLSPGVYTAFAFFLDPSDDTEHCPASISLTVQAAP